LVQQLLQTTTPPSTPALASDIAPQVDAHCTACGRTSQESQQLMAGSQAVLCAVCVREIDNSRVASGEQCMLCGQDAFAAVETYRHADVVICCSCLDQSVGLIERQEIDQVLARW
jgi:hypothetical protein